jgi:hypothetical protein
MTVSWHPPDKAAGVFVFDKGQAHANMAAAGGRAGEVFRHFVEMHVAVIGLEEKLHGALQPCMQAAQASRLDQIVVIEIAQAHVFEPCHQKSSADGIRL